MVYDKSKIFRQAHYTILANFLMIGYVMIQHLSEKEVLKRISISCLIEKIYLVILILHSFQYDLYYRYVI